MELTTNDTSEKKPGMDGVSIAALTFVLFGGVLFPPFAILILFLCLLEMLIKPGQEQTPGIKDDTDIYRTVVRPVGRWLVWSPVAALLVMLILGITFTLMAKTGIMFVALVALDEGKGIATLHAAVEACDKAIKLAPADAMAFCYQGNALVSLGLVQFLNSKGQEAHKNFQSAVASFKEAVKRNPDTAVTFKHDIAQAEGYANHGLEKSAREIERQLQQGE